MSQLESYDNTTDPLYHLESNKALISIQDTSNALFYIAFPSILQKAARAWYSQLKWRSINSFKHLERKFVAHFNVSRKISWEVNNFFSIHQHDRESLKDYMVQFNAATLEIYNLDDCVAILALKRELCTSHFTYSLNKTYPKSYLEMLDPSQKYIRTDEGALTQQKMDEKPRKKQA